MHTAYQIDLTQAQANYVLSEEESMHVAKVLRLDTGKQIYLCNGKGLKAVATIELAHPKKTAVSILEFHAQEEAPKFPVHIAIAPTKNMDRLEWFLEKATELGLDKVTLLKCKNNERKMVKMERLEKIVIAAMKQSQRTYKPELTDLTPFSEFVQEQKGYIAHCYDELAEEKQNYLEIAESKPILIGPEGDFTMDEVQLASKYGWTQLDLGKNRLRTETAALLSTMRLIQLYC
ncbi:MAG: 16S rRNA (uracil(1498)-N(3))-methyltransferase [Crocinitomicaceae bacterium]|jgi:16S rRNA (uracil1498-N3)-methyltransferase|nr:16S rRNA (uracil(1498)-N(3))-methyltransferase [Crocinitomicaceae bacterium]